MYVEWEIQDQISIFAFFSIEKGSRMKVERFNDVPNREQR